MFPQDGSETSVNSTRLHGATTQKTAIFVLTAVRTSNPTCSLKILIPILGLSSLRLFDKNVAYKHFSFSMWVLHVLKLITLIMVRFQIITVASMKVF
jgi:hypothetical protein